MKLRFKPMRLSRRSKIFAIISTSLLIWGGQTYVWNPFWLDYAAYPWYALIWAFTITWIIPKRKLTGEVANKTTGILLPSLEKKPSSDLLDDPLPPPSLESLQEPENV